MARASIFRRPTRQPPSRRRRRYPTEVDLSVIPASVSSSFTVGTLTVSTGVQPVSRSSSFTVGVVTVSLDLDPTNRTIRPRPAVKHELVCVRVVPQAMGPPGLIEVAEVPWTGLTYADTLRQPQRLEAGCKVSNLPEDVIQQMEIGGLTTELKLLRNGKPVFNGPLFGFTVQGGGEGVSLQAVGLLAYLRLMWLEETKTYTQIDQFSIAADLINNFQSREYGHYGIDTSAVGLSGALRDHTYDRDEGHQVSQRVEELGKVANGFDTKVDPATRKLVLSYPFQGVDRSTGEDAIILDGRAVTSGNIVASSAPEDVASEGYAVGTGTGAGEKIYHHEPNLELRARYGRRGVFQTFDRVSVMSTLVDHAQGLLATRGAPLLVPGPGLRVTADADLDRYDVGDTVQYALHSRLRLKGAFRVRSRQVKVDTEQELADLTFV